eukprot:TRINITY_DN41806_c0_g1_i1.p1 TRINITY_DN41806_c0_g1~~TRINITY_DN41806_c0_g1_i1.p1  ORF type:complete len:814 (-),score=103.87 TRINITY_DN41806_c0_g1_i1:45-2486(-)
MACGQPQLLAAAAAPRSSIVPGPSAIPGWSAQPAKPVRSYQTGGGGGGGWSGASSPRSHLTGAPGPGIGQAGLHAIVLPPEVAAAATVHTQGERSKTFQSSVLPTYGPRLGAQTIPARPPPSMTGSSPAAASARRSPSPTAGAVMANCFSQDAAAAQHNSMFCGRTERGDAVIHRFRKPSPQRPSVTLRSLSEDIIPPAESARTETHGAAAAITAAAASNAQRPYSPRRGGTAIGMKHRATGSLAQGLLSEGASDPMLARPLGGAAKGRGPSPPREGSPCPFAREGVAVDDLPCFRIAATEDSGTRRAGSPLRGRVGATSPRPRAEPPPWEKPSQRVSAAEQPWQSSGEAAPAASASLAAATVSPPMSSVPVPVPATASQDNLVRRLQTAPMPTPACLSPRTRTRTSTDDVGCRTRRSVSPRTSRCNTSGGLFHLGLTQEEPETQQERPLGGMQKGRGLTSPQGLANADCGLGPSLANPSERFAGTVSGRAPSPMTTERRCRSPGAQSPIAGGSRRTREPTLSSMFSPRGSLKPAPTTAVPEASKPEKPAPPAAGHNAADGRPAAAAPAADTGPDAGAGAALPHAQQATKPQPSTRPASPKPAATTGGRSPSPKPSCGLDKGLARIDTAEFIRRGSPGGCKKGRQSPRARAEGARAPPPWASEVSGNAEVVGSTGGGYQGAAGGRPNHVSRSRHSPSPPKGRPGERAGDGEAVPRTAPYAFHAKDDGPPVGAAAAAAKVRAEREVSPGRGRFVASDRGVGQALLLKDMRRELRNNLFGDGDAGAGRGGAHQSPEAAASAARSSKHSAVRSAAI